MGLRLLGGLTPAQFLKDYWQKRPLLVRGAIPGFVDLVTRDELSKLAAETEVASRLIMEHGAKRPWQLQHGPFTPTKLRRLPKTHWSLLVSNLEQKVEGAALLLEQFNFIPSWRAEDIMVSFAPEHGSVGPHVDAYDVFLLQGLGRRRWGIAEDFDPRIKPDLDIRVLRQFSPEQEWVLDPGDLLYLPPRVAHYGVALEDCLTYSVGFRAPMRAELIEDLFKLPLSLYRLVCGVERYADPDLEVQANPGEINAATLRRIQAIVAEPLTNEEMLGRWFGAFITRPEVTVAKRRRPSAEQVRALIREPRLCCGEQVRMAYYAGRSDQVYVFAGGDEMELPRSLLALVERLCLSRRFPGADLAHEIDRLGSREDQAAAFSLLSELYARRALQRLCDHFP